MPKLSLEKTAVRQGQLTDFQLRSSYTFTGISNNTGQRQNITLQGNAGINALAGDQGNTIDAGAGNDIVMAGTGNDSVKAGTGNDVVWGMAGNDSIKGGDGNDQLEGDGTTKTGYLQSTAASQHGADSMDGGSAKAEHYQLNSGRPPYLLACRPIRYLKVAKKDACHAPAVTAASGRSVSVMKTRAKARTKFSPKLIGICLVPALIFFTEIAFSAENWDFAMQHKNQCSAGSQLEMNLCLEREKNKVESQLIEKNNRLQALLARPQDAVSANLAWLKFRDQECRFASSGLEKGQSLYQFALHACNIDLTQKRIRDLDAHIISDCNGCPPRRIMIPKQ